MSDQQDEETFNYFADLPARGRSFDWVAKLVESTFALGYKAAVCDGAEEALFSRKWNE